jgi:predicted signal transduction protein with EAL and GGDEF domain
MLRSCTQVPMAKAIVVAALFAVATLSQSLANQSLAMGSPAVHTVQPAGPPHCCVA